MSEKRAERPSHRVLLIFMAAVALSFFGSILLNVAYTSTDFQQAPTFIPAMVLLILSVILLCISGLVCCKVGCNNCWRDCITMGSGEIV